MQDRQTERGPRGKYARLICRGCRSRKIKCVLPETSNINPSNTPQPSETSCERCRNLDLECIVERASLGRPAAKRSRPSDTPTNGATTLAELDVDQETCPDMAKLEIKEYLYSHAIVDNPEPEEVRTHAPSQALTEEDIFQSMMESSCFFALIYSKDQVFGSSIVHAGTRQIRPLLDLISKDMAQSLDGCLVWHRFFVPQLPTLMDLRKRMVAEGIFVNCATNLLFAFLCLTALEMPEGPTKQYSNLKQSLQLCISTYGQEFIFDTPVHRDSVLVALLLSDYKPTALATSQRVVAKSVKSRLFVHIAYYVGERLGILPAQLNSDVNRLIALDPQSLENYILDSVQGLQVHYYDASLGGFAGMPLHKMRRTLSRIKPQMDALRDVLKYRQLSPKLIHHVQFATATFMTMRGMMDVKGSCSSPDAISIILDNFEMECLEQIQFSNSLLSMTMSYCKQDEIIAAQALLELRFRLSSHQIAGMGLLYVIILRTRLERGCGAAGGGPEISSNEASTIASQTVSAFTNIPTESSPLDPCIRLQERMGGAWSGRLKFMLQLFLDRSESLKLDGVAFHPPCRHLVLEIVRLCKNIVENNIVHIKITENVHANFDEQCGMVRRCAQLIGAMAVSPGNSMDSAFAGGSLYAASCKLIHGLCDVMECIIRRFLDAKKEREQTGLFDMPLNFDFSGGVGPDFHSDEWNLLPFVGAGDTNFGDGFDWTSALHLFESTPSDFLPD